MRGALFLGLAVTAGCGGNVIVDGAGGAVTTTSVTTTTSITTTSTTTTTTTTTAGCPAPFPGIEAPCSEPGQVCPVPDACCGGLAACANGFWSYTGSACAQPCSLPCGPNDFACQGGSVCVAYIGQTTIYQCVADPCSGTLSCACAAGLCAAEGMMCNNVQMGFKILCD